MKFKAAGLVALIMTVTLLVQAFGFVRARVTGAHSDESTRIARFETLLESLRQDLKIPAYSAAIVKDQKVIWARGFGYADVENKIPATEHTAYHLASLTKTFASTILMQLIQEGKVKLDDPVSKYGIVLESNGVIRVRPVTELKNQLNLLASKPYADIYRTDLVTKLRIYQSVGRANDGLRLVKLYGERYSKPMPADLVKLPLVAQIVEVLDNEDKTVTFSLASNQGVRIFAVGEGQPGEMFDYGWIEDDKGSRVWEMKEPQTTHAGGAGKNRKLDVIITLPAGNYKLRYKSDDSHAFDHWNSLPPDINFWGIAVYKK